MLFGLAGISSFDILTNATGMWELHVFYACCQSKQTGIARGSANLLIRCQWVDGVRIVHRKSHWGLTCSANKPYWSNGVLDLALVYGVYWLCQLANMTFPDTVVRSEICTSKCLRYIFSKPATTSTGYRLWTGIACSQMVFNSSTFSPFLV